MGALIAAIALFGAIWAIIAAIRAEDPRPSYGDAPGPLPQPGARDLHSVMPGTLGRVRVPRWT